MDVSDQATNPAGAPAGLQTIQILSSTRPWVLSCSILGGLGSVLLGVAGIALSMEWDQSAGVGHLAATLGTGIFYILLAFFYLLPSIKLWKYASAIRRFAASGSDRDLEKAVDQQRGFWKLAGIFVILGIVSVVVIAVGAFGFALFSPAVS